MLINGRNALAASGQAQAVGGGAGDAHRSAHRRAQHVLRRDGEQVVTGVVASVAVFCEAELLKNHGAAGELFYVPFGDPRDKHRSDTNPSGDRIAEITRNLAKKYRSSVLTEPYSTVDILNAAKEGDALGKAVVAQEAERIALYIAAVSAITDVELVVLSGGIGRQAEFFLSPIKKLVSEILPFPPKIAVSKLGDNGILIGTLQIATEEAREKVFQSAMVPAALDQAK